MISTDTNHGAPYKITSLPLGNPMIIISYTSDVLLESNWN